MTKTRSLAALALACVLWAAVAAPAFAADKSVSVGDNFYSPPTVTISVGDSVTWTNNGQAPHTVTADNGSFDSSPSCPDNFDTCMQPGDTYSHTFNTAGTFGYFCKVHGQSMSGTVVVQGAGGSPAPSEPGATGLPNTGSGPETAPFLWLGVLFVLCGGVVLFALRRRRA